MVGSLTQRRRLTIVFTTALRVVVWFRSSRSAFCWRAFFWRSRLPLQAAKACMSMGTRGKTARTFIHTTALLRALLLTCRALYRPTCRTRPPNRPRQRLSLLARLSLPSLLTLPCTFIATTNRMERTFRNTSGLYRALPTRLSARLRENPSIRQPLLWKRPLSLPPPLLLSLRKRLPRTVHLRQALSETPTDGSSGANLQSMNLCE